jgi:predicted transcriptional regulator
MELKIVLDLLDSANASDDQPPHKVIEQLNSLGLIERRDARWQVTEAGLAALESFETEEQ